MKWWLLLGAMMPGAYGELVVHEWGTFTSLQAEDGRALGGINTDDEPVPAFVHDIARGLLLPASEAPPTFSQGAPSAHPDVTMRLETPVIYFHGLASERRPIEVKVAFRGGWPGRLAGGSWERA